VKEFIDRLSAETGVPAPDVERLLVKILAPQLRATYEAEVAESERQRELQERQDRERRRVRASVRLKQRWAPP
jgi:hypothetical protein